MSHLLIDERSLPPSLKLKMPEYLNFVDSLRALIVAKGFVSEQPWEKREMKCVTEMLSHFLYNALQENAELIK